MGAKEEDGKLDVGWLHSTIWDFINLSGKSKYYVYQSYGIDDKSLDPKCFVDS